MVRKASQKDDVENSGSHWIDNIINIMMNSAPYKRLAKKMTGGG